MPMPDKVIEEARKEEQVSSINVEDDMGIQSCLSSLNEVGEARGAVLSLRLDKVSESVKGQKNIDSKGYLTELNSTIINTDTDISDFKKARTLLQSLIESNPRNAAG